LAPLSAVGAAFHIIAHAFGKITLFFAAGSIYTAAHKTEINQLDGIGRSMPWTMGAFAVGTLSMIGLPPSGGFVSKWFMMMGAFQTGQMVAVGILIVSTLLNAAYFVPIVYIAFFREPAEHGRHDDHGHHEPAHGEAPLPIVIATVVTATLSVLLFFFPDVPFTLAEQMLDGVTGGAP
ncbi:MAG: proton-conducting transporter membrane subunit, partial [Phycisphaeraceae bacterium]